MEKLFLQTTAHTEMIDITSQIQKILQEKGIKEGLVYIHIPHTTAGITINENADPDVVNDILLKVNEVIDDDPRFQHAEGNSDAHIKSSLFGSSLNLIISNGKLQLGAWQGVYFCEFDGSRKREVWMKVIAE